MSILSKPWRVSLQRSPNLLSFLTANEVQTRRAGSSVPYAQICTGAQRKADADSNTQTTTGGSDLVRFSFTSAGHAILSRNETTLTGRSSLSSCRQHRYLAVLQFYGIESVQ